MTRLRRPQLALIVLLVALAVGYGIKAVRDHHDAKPNSSSSQLSTGNQTGDQSMAPAQGTVVPLSTLPAQAAQTVTLIEHHGPFPYSQDGVVFDNNEKHLPIEKRGYYHEYTVDTPGSPDRGARRIITGANGEYYYTDDHYDTFVQVDVTQ
ncbi:Guanyl-specific ribonuclease Sa [Frankineae bacterium MT45]|nr:Guanyl-specific ribonuclease Sa [Frankineae bacterium MT45]